MPYKCPCWGLERPKCAALTGLVRAIRQMTRLSGLRGGARAARGPARASHGEGCSLGPIDGGRRRRTRRSLPAPVSGCGHRGVPRRQRCPAVPGVRGAEGVLLRHLVAARLRACRYFRQASPSVARPGRCHGGSGPATVAARYEFGSARSAAAAGAIRSSAHAVWREGSPCTARPKGGVAKSHRRRSCQRAHQALSASRATPARPTETTSLPGQGERRAGGPGRVGACLSWSPERTARWAGR
jgi:hypothetical protein